MAETPQQTSREHPSALPPTLGDDPERLRRKAAKKRLVRAAIGVCLLLFLFAVWLETRVFSLGTVDLPVSGNVLVFALININVLLLLVVAFLVLRNLAELVFERQHQLLGSKLRTKLVASFVAMSLIPTALLFFVSLQFVSSSMDYWFNASVADSLERSLELARDAYRSHQERARQVYRRLAARLDGVSPAEGQERLARVVDETVVAAAIYGAGGTVAARAGADLPPLDLVQVRRLLAGESLEWAQRPGQVGGEILRLAGPLPLAEGTGGLEVAYLIPAAQLENLTSISRGLEGYRQLMVLKPAIKASLLVLLGIVTLLIVFAAVWFGFYVAGTLTGPIGKLAEATRLVAEGRLDFELQAESDDEMGTLVASFNRMTRDLASGQAQLQAAHQALASSYSELEERRRYIETILQNVTAGVISLDEHGRVTTFNRYAEELLGVDGSQIRGRHYRSVLRAAHLSILEEHLAALEASGRPAIQRLIRLTVAGETFSLRVNFVRLTDEAGHPLGVVIVFDNLTELERAQRMAAWREVARRIAHEVKNPLTPIQLSAQRLRKKYGPVIGEEAFDTCTRTIIDQVEELKKLVGEFSSFARMPAVERRENAIGPLLTEVVTLYREAHPALTFHLHLDPVPVFPFDRAQLKRVLVNLLDNAVAVLGPGGTVTVRCTPKNGRVVLTVEDDGPGVAPEVQRHLFEPYYSTKKSGTGLGLSIAATIVGDHGGAITMENREPHGARFIVTLPLESTAAPA